MAMEIRYSNVSADYQLGPIRTKNVLDDVNLFVKPSSFTAIVGQTGAGKSSLLKVMNGLIRPKQGEVKIGKYSVSSNNDPTSLKEVRKRIGMVFQFPESQLFAETVEKDICFGPLNFGVGLSEAKEMAKTAIYQVGLDASFLPKSPFSLSGGQKRRVAIAGILAMKPDILILDEPGAGLDPIGKQEILSLIASWNKNNKLTTLMVTHEMDDVAKFADDVIVMEKGKISNDHRNLTVTDTSDHPWRTSNVSQSKGQNFINSKNPGTNEQKNEARQPTIFTDTDTKNNLLAMKEVIDTNVIISNNNAYVAVVLQQRQKLTSKMKNQITDQVKKNHPQIDHVYISENPHFIQQMSEFSRRLKRGDQNVTEDFNQMLNDYFAK